MGTAAVRKRQFSMLVSSDSPVDGVASACGFGTTQGFRESIKEYLGLVPSELRGLPEIVDPALNAVLQSATTKARSPADEASGIACTP